MYKEITVFEVESWEDDTDNHSTEYVAVANEDVPFIEELLTSVKALRKQGEWEDLPIEKMMADLLVKYPETTDALKTSIQSHPYEVLVDFISEPVNYDWGGVRVIGSIKKHKAPAPLEGKTLRWVIENPLKAYIELALAMRKENIVK